MPASALPPLARDVAPAAVALPLVGGATSDSIEISVLANAPQAQGKARVTIARQSAIQAAGAPATITLDGENVAEIWSGSSAIVDSPVGANVLAASASGECKGKFNTVAGKSYKLEISPRAASIGHGMLGSVGGMINACANENAGGEMRAAAKQ